MENSTYYDKYLKYKEKYLNLKNSLEGGKGSYGSRNRRSGYYPTYSSNPSAQITTTKPAVTSSPKPAVTSSPKPAVTSSPKPAVTSSPKPAVTQQTSSPSPAVLKEITELYEKAFPKFMSNMGYGHCSSHMSTETVQKFNKMTLVEASKKLTGDLKKFAERNSKEFPTFGDIRKASKSLSCVKKTSSSSSSSWMPSGRSVTEGLAQGLAMSMR